MQTAYIYLQRIVLFTENVKEQITTKLHPGGLRTAIVEVLAQVNGAPGNGYINVKSQRSE